MTMEQFIRRNYRMYQNMAAKLRVHADYTDDIIQRADYMARASAYRIAADDMLEIIESADDIKRPVGVTSTGEPKG